jgi:hypothetical protein
MDTQILGVVKQLRDKFASVDDEIKEHTRPSNTRNWLEGYGGGLAYAIELFRTVGTEIWVLEIEAENIAHFVSLHKTEEGARREAVKVIEEDYYLAGSNFEEKFATIREKEQEEGAVVDIYQAGVKE